MNIDSMTIGELKQIQQLIGGKQTSGATAFEIGKSYLIRTVTNFYTGRLIKIFDNELMLEKAAWIADTGRYYDALKKGTLSEVEPIIGDCIVSRGSIVDAVLWAFDLPEVQK
jgi:hypothetical protein